MVIPNRISRDKRIQQDGIFHIPLVLFTLILALTGFGLWGSMQGWRNKVGIQLRLNQCVGEAALELRDCLDSIAGNNHRMHVTRAAIATAILAQPEAVPGLQSLLQVLKASQEVQRYRWRMRQIQWGVRRGCGGGDLPYPLPGIKVFRPPPDPLGESPLEWDEQKSQSFYLQLIHLPRISTARVEGGSIGNLLESKKWKASWSTPQRP